uniref:Cadherin domain-containing protein n=1 Tax=Glossina austeni TaxID=7395 RepID=A0A1A9UX48_GLOAU
MLRIMAPSHNISYPYMLNCKNIYYRRMPETDNNNNNYNSRCHCISSWSYLPSSTSSSSSSSSSSSLSSSVCCTSQHVTRHFSTIPLLSWTTAYRILTITLLIDILSTSPVLCVDPKFDPSTRMRLVLVPSDAQVGSVIYRLRATDEEFDYPLTFELVSDASSSTINIESLPCTKYNSVCQANVVLQRRLEPGRYYDFQVSVKDTKGGMATQLCSITATNFTTPHDLIFPHKPGIIMIPEVSKPFTKENKKTIVRPSYGTQCTMQLQLQLQLYSCYKSIRS